MFMCLFINMFGLNILKMAEDRDSVPMQHL